MTPHGERHLELCAGYRLGALDAPERAALDAHLAEGCRPCEAELARLLAAPELLAASVPLHRAPASIREQVLAAIRAPQPAPALAPPPLAEAAAPGVATAPPQPESFAPAAATTPAAFDSAEILRSAELPAPPRARSVAGIWAVVAAALAIATFAGWRTTTRLSEELAATRAESVRLARDRDEERRWNEPLDSPGARVVDLQPTPDGEPGPAARVTYDPVTHRARVACAHFAPPPGRAYAFWAVTKDGPNGLGFVRPDSAGVALVRIEDAGEPDVIDAFAFSLEPAAAAPGARAPTGPLVLLGRLGH